MTIRVLLADDHAVVRRSLRALLEEDGGECEVCGEAADGAAAVRLVGELAPDIAVLDISMPGLSGLEAAPRIRALRPAPEVLIVTMHDSEHLVGLAIVGGAKGYLLKSEAPDHLVRAVVTIAREHRPYFTGQFTPAMWATALEKASPA